jgi:hypothetical protein
LIVEECDFGGLVTMDANPVDPLIEYEAALFANRRIYLLNHNWSFFAYRQIHETFTVLGHVLSNGRDRDRNSYE